MGSTSARHPTGERQVLASSVRWPGRPRGSPWHLAQKPPPGRPRGSPLPYTKRRRCGICGSCCWFRFVPCLLQRLRQGHYCLFLAHQGFQFLMICPDIFHARRDKFMFGRASSKSVQSALRRLVFQLYLSHNTRDFAFVLAFVHECSVLPYL